MPTPSGSPLTDAQRTLALDWIDQGAPDCLDDADPVTFNTQAEATCGDVSYDDDIEPIITNNCVGCHFAAQTEIPSMETYEDGLAVGIHPYYQPLTIWESSLYRHPRLLDADVLLGRVPSPRPRRNCAVPNVG